MFILHDSPGENCKGEIEDSLSFRGTPSQWIEVPVNGNKIHKEVPEGFATAGGF